MFGFGRKKAEKTRNEASFQASYDATQKFLTIVTAHVEEKMPAVCEWYVDLLVKRLGEASNDPEEIHLIWEGFKISLEDVPRLVEENIREQYAESWDFFKEAGLQHILSGLIKQEAAKFTDPLPEQIRAEILKA